MKTDSPNPNVKLCIAKPIELAYFGPSQSVRIFISSIGILCLTSITFDFCALFIVYVDLSPLRTTQHVNPSTIGENSMQTTVQIATLNDPVLIISDSESDSGSYEPPVVENYCVDCKQAYASKSTLKKHLKSRKHAEAVAGKTSGIAQQSVNIVNADMSNNARKFRYCGPCNGSFQRIDIHHKTKRHLNNVNAI